MTYSSEVIEYHSDFAPGLAAMGNDLYDPVRRYPPSKILSMISGGASFPFLELILDPTRTLPLLLRDAILVSIDLESRIIEPLGKRQITQIGTASLDTRILAEIDTEDSQSLINAVQSRVFSVHPKRASAKAWVPTSLWATPEKIGHDEICDKLNEVLHNIKDGSVAKPDGVLGIDLPTSHNEVRNIVLVGHSIRSDRSLLIELLDFDIKDVTSIRAILDTGRMICSAYDFGIASHSHFPLRMILRCLGVRYDQLHDAGNDAMFTMKAVLLMFSNWKSQKGKHLWNVAEAFMSGDSRSPQLTSIKIAENELWECQLEVLTAIAREPWPVAKKLATSHRSKVLIPPIKAETDLLLLTDDLELTHMFS